MLLLHWASLAARWLCSDRLAGVFGRLLHHEDDARMRLVCDPCGSRSLSSSCLTAHSASNIRRFGFDEMLLDIDALSVSIPPPACLQGMLHARMRRMDVLTAYAAYVWNAVDGIWRRISTLKAVRSPLTRPVASVWSDGTVVVVVARSVLFSASHCCHSVYVFSNAVISSSCKYSMRNALISCKYA